MAPELNQAKITLFCNWSYIPNEDTLIKDIHKVPRLKLVTFEDGKINILDLKYHFNIKHMASYGDIVKDHLPQAKRYLNSLSGGFDSNLILKLMVDRGDKPDTFTIGSSVRKNEIPEAVKISEHYNLINHHSIVANSGLQQLPDICIVIEDSFIEIGIFLQNELIKLLKDHYTPEWVITLGECSDQILNQNYTCCPDTISASDLFHGKYFPQLSAWNRILRKNGSFLRYYNLNYYYPFINQDMIKYAEGLEI